MFSKIVNILGGVAAFRKILNVLANTIRDWKRRRSAKKAQKESNRIDRNHRAEWERMFDNNQNAD